MIRRFFFTQGTELGVLGPLHIKPHSPRLNGKVERSHRTDEVEFYQLLEYKGDVDLEKRLSEWQQYYNLYRPHTAHGGRTPFEVLHEKLKGQTHAPRNEAKQQPETTT